MHTEERCLGETKWKNIGRYCQKMSKSFTRDVFRAILESKLSVEKELDDPSVPGVLSRALEVTGVTQTEAIKEHIFHQSQQSADENAFYHVRRVGAVKTLAMKERSFEF